MPVAIPYTEPVDPGTITPKLDTFVLLGRATASVNESVLSVSCPRAASFKEFFVSVMIYPAAGVGNLATERPIVYFNDDRSLGYEVSYRSFKDVADTPASTEAPTAENVKDQGQLALLPSLSNYLVQAADMFNCWMFFTSLDAENRYHIDGHWALGEPVYTGTNKHPRHGRFVAKYVGATAGARISKMHLEFSAATRLGGLGAGSQISVYGKRSPLLDQDWDYSYTKSGSTNAVWMPTQKAMFRRTFSFVVPAPGSPVFYPLPDTSFDPATVRVTELWMYNPVTGVSETCGPDLQVYIGTTSPYYLTFYSPPAGRDLTIDYFFGYAVVTWARP